MELLDKLVISLLISMGLPMSTIPNTGFASPASEKLRIGADT